MYISSEAEGEIRKQGVALDNSQAIGYVRCHVWGLENVLLEEGV